MDYDRKSAPAVPLLPYQKEWIKDRSRFKAGMMSRQSGKTFSATLEIVDRIMESFTQGKREEWIILSRGERQAREALNEGVKRHCMAYGAMFKSMEYDWEGASASYRAHEIELPGGARITALPANPDTARGFSRNVLLDEFAFHMDSRRIWAAVFPVITRRQLSIRIISTPNGKENKFYDIINDKAGKWSIHVTDIYQAVEQGLKVDPAELKSALNDDEAWAREYELSWLDEASAWLSYDLIASVEAPPEEAARYSGGPCYVGVDIGRKHDLWAAAVVEKTEDALWLREMTTLNRQSFAVQDAELDRIMTSYDARLVAMDETGLGAKPVEDAKARYGKQMVEGVVFTGQAKSLLATIAKRAFEEKRIRIPENKALRRDLHKLKKTVTATGAPRFDAPSGPEGHADRAWALFLAILAASRETGIVEYQSLKRPTAAGAGFGANDIKTPVMEPGFGSVLGGVRMEDY